MTLMCCSKAGPCGAAGSGKRHYEHGAGSLAHSERSIRLQTHLGIRRYEHEHENYVLCLKNLEILVSGHLSIHDHQYAAAHLLDALLIHHHIYPEV